MPAYSFKNVACSITGPGPLGIMTIPLSGGVGAAKEGIKIADTDDKNEMNQGADGVTEHSLKASDAAGADVNLQQTSKVHFLLAEMFNFQKQNSVFWGQNTINVIDFARGDVEILTECAFKRRPDSSFADVAGNVQWQFDVGTRDMRKGPGRPVL